MTNERQHNSVEPLVDLIDSGKFQRADELLKTSRSTEPLMLINEAEVHTYFHRLDEAGELLNQLRPEDLKTPDSARLALTRGEWHYWRFEYEPAEQMFHIAKRMYRFIEDDYGLAKAFYNLGRLNRRQDKFEPAQQLLKKALDLMEAHRGEKKDFLKALIDFNQGVCAHQAGQLDKAADLYSSAIVTLNKLEHGVYYGVALSSYGMVLMRKGMYEESLSVHNQAIGVLQGIGAFEPLGSAMNNKATTLIRMRRFEEAERLLQESLELFQRAGHIGHVAAALQTFAERYLGIPDFRQAEKYAKQAIEYADLSRNDLVKVEALIALGRVSLKRNDFFADDKSLSQALELAQKLNNKVVEMTALLYLAECELFYRPAIARERLNQVRQMLEAYPYVWLEQEMERIVQRTQGERLRITSDNWLQINGNLLPNWYAAKEALESFLVKNALEQGKTFQKAGEILGVSKVHVREKKLQYKL
jgi:tetratricopeptide (TPR) repeat protein